MWYLAGARAAVLPPPPPAPPVPAAVLLLPAPAVLPEPLVAGWLLLRAAAPLL